MEILSEFGYRQDGRRANEPRLVKCRLGVYRQADGSAFLAQGLTKVLAAVYGPHEVSRSRRAQRTLHDRAYINCQFSAATFSQAERKLRPRGDRKSQEMQLQLQKTFEAAIVTATFPRSQIDIFVEVLQSDGGTLPACINAATLALIDAGVPLKDFVCACSVSVQGDTPLVDVTYAEESHGGGGGGPQLSMAVLPSTEQVVLLEQHRRLHVSQLQLATHAAMAACVQLGHTLRAHVRDHVQSVAEHMCSDDTT